MRWLSLIAALAFSLSCGETDRTPLTMYYHVIGVEGTVTVDGSGVPNATVAASIRRGDCRSGIPDGGRQTTTSQSGTYVMLITSSERAGPRCILASTSAGGRTATAQIENVQMPARFPSDTVRLDFAFR